MKVYILIEDYGHDGEEVVGVYGKKEKAEDEKAKLKPTNICHEGYRIDEHEVQ